MRRAGRIDSNQPEIVAALRKVGCSVAITSALGDGYPDLVVRTPGRCGLIVLMECKTKVGKLTPAQREFFATFPETLEIRSTEEALRAVGVRAI